MLRCTVLDTFPAFRAVWERVQGQPLDAQIEAWASEYMSAWPELRSKQQDDYASQDLDWRRVARERIFPGLSARLPAMRAAHGALLSLCEPLYARAQAALGFESDALCVIYVGIGCGAGWVTRLHGAPAILFGLENMAEQGWIASPALDGLVAHEIGHLAHHHWRKQASQPLGDGPWWQLYEEGFAQRCEHWILGYESWHEALATAQDDWLAWCQAHQSWLAGEFLRVVDAGEAVQPFFGSWYEMQGRSQCGYFLGHQVIQILEADLTQRQIAVLSSAEVEARLRSVLAKMACAGQSGAP